MKVFNNTNISKNFRNSALAIGNFDGVHLGHKKVFQNTKKIAKRKGIKFGVLTFTPLPIMFFNKKIKNYKLTNHQQKKNLFVKLLMMEINLILTFLIKKTWIRKLSQN